MLYYAHYESPGYNCSFIIWIVKPINVSVIKISKKSSHIYFVGLKEPLLFYISL